MNAKDARQLIIEIASRNVGKREDSPNRAPWIKPLWPETSYPEGYANREPYCAAGMCWVLATFIRELAALGELKDTLGMTLIQAEKWRCKSARAFGWRDWAIAKGLMTIPDTGQPLPGDFIVFDFSHIGLVTESLSRFEVATVEYNTNDGGSREGDGCMAKERANKLAQCFIRLPFLGSRTMFWH